MSDGGVILTVDPRSYYLEGPAYQNQWGLMKVQEKTFEEQLAWLRARGIAYWIYPETWVASSETLRKLTPMFQAWRNDAKHFKLIERLALPVPGAAGVEYVEIWAVNLD